MTQTTPHYDELAVPGVRGLHPYEPGKPLAELERENLHLRQQRDILKKTLSIVSAVRV